MEVSGAGKVEKGNLEEMEPSSSSSEKDSSVSGLNRRGQGLTNSQEIESVEAGISDREVETDVDKGEEMSRQQSYDAGPSSPREQMSGESRANVVEGDSLCVKGSLGVSQVTESDETRGTLDPVSTGDNARSFTVVEVGSTQVQIPTLAMVSIAEAPLLLKKTDCHVIDVPVKDSVKVQELDGYKGFPIPRTTSNFSVESAAGDLCRICQQHSEEPVMELGCRCRGELAKAHRSCIDQWFGNKGTNKCEVCQHVATNVPVPSSQPTPHFWVWRVGGGTYNNTGGQRRGGGVGPLRLYPLPMRPVLLMTLRRHPTIMLLWLLLFAFMAYLFVDVTDSASIGYAAMPIGFLFGVLVVLGLGTAARLVLECWHERVIRRNIRRMEEDPSLDDFSAERSTTNVQTQPLQSTVNSAVPVSPRTPAIQGAGASQVASRPSDMVVVT